MVPSFRQDGRTLSMELSDDEGGGTQSFSDASVEDMVQESPPQFQTLAQGPLGDLAIVKNRQIVEEQLREVEDFLRQVGVGQVACQAQEAWKKEGGP